MISAGVGEAGMTPQAYYQANYTASCWEMGASATAAVANTIGQIASGVILGNAQQRTYASQSRMEDTKLAMNVRALNTEAAKLDVTAQQTEYAHESKLKLAEAQGNFDIVHAQVVEEKRTEEASRIDTKALDRMFEDSRRQRSTGNPVLPIPESRSDGGLSF